MNLREATLADLPRLCEIAVAAFTGVSFFEFLYPDHHQHPAAFNAYFRTDLRNHILAPNNVVMVAEDAEMATIIAFSVWIFWPADGSLHTPRLLESNAPKVDMAKSSLRQRLSRTTTALTSRLPSWPQPGPRYPDPAGLATFTAEFARVISDIWGEQYKVHWHLRFLATEPAWQGRGAGTRLLRWGQTQAASEGLAVMLEPGSDKSHAFYMNRSFKVLGHFELGGKRYDEIYWEGEKEEEESS
ncbi:acyl-CoA N-acyltransferase [Geopyxis carbonaria]|nr:acyl-CoA N-acyltransferase [Geopyxis carbonaria]